jgi:hypothetical protein
MHKIRYFELNIREGNYKAFVLINQTGRRGSKPRIFCYYLCNNVWKWIVSERANLDGWNKSMEGKVWAIDKQGKTGGGGGNVVDLLNADD